MGFKNKDFPNAEYYSNKALSIPIHAYISLQDAKFIISKINRFLKLHKLILGSAQFAENYGVVRNKIPLEVFDLLSLCKVEGIDKIDTSIEYGNAHEFISKSKLHQKFKIITKVSLKNLSLDSCSETDLEVKFNKFISSFI